MRRVSYLVLFVLFVSIFVCWMTSCNDVHGRNSLGYVNNNIEFISDKGYIYAYVIKYEGKKYMMNPRGGVLEIK